MGTEELQMVREKMRSLQQQMSQTEQIARELRAQEDDTTEALRAKDSQLAVLRVRLEDAEKELQQKLKVMQGLESEKDRCVKFAMYKLFCLWNILFIW